MTVLESVIEQARTIASFGITRSGRGQGMRKINSPARPELLTGVSVEARLKFPATFYHRKANVAASSLAVV